MKIDRRPGPNALVLPENPDGRKCTLERKRRGAPFLNEFKTRYILSTGPAREVNYMFDKYFAYVSTNISEIAPSYERYS